MSTKIASFLSILGAVLNGIGVGNYSSGFLFSGSIVWVISNLLWMHHTKKNREQYYTFTVFFIAAVYGTVLCIIRGV